MHSKHERLEQFPQQSNSMSSRRKWSIPSSGQGANLRRDVLAEETKTNFMLFIVACAALENTRCLLGQSCRLHFTASAHLEISRSRVLSARKCVRGGSPGGSRCFIDHLREAVLGARGVCVSLQMITICVQPLNEAVQDTSGERDMCSITGSDAVRVTAGERDMSKSHTESTWAHPQSSATKVLQYLPRTRKRKKTQNCPAPLRSQTHVARQA